MESILDMSIDDVVDRIEYDLRTVEQNMYAAGALAGSRGGLKEHNLKERRAEDGKARIRNAVTVLAMRAKGI